MSGFFEMHRTAMKEGTKHGNTHYGFWSFEHRTLADFIWQNSPTVERGGTKMRVNAASPIRTCVRDTFLSTTTTAFNMPARAKPSKPFPPRGARSVKAERKAAKRRAAGRRYYAGHPEAREKSRLRMAEKRPVSEILSQKLYRRQWDAPKKKIKKYTGAEQVGKDEAISATLEDEEAVAYQALRSMSRKRQYLESEVTVEHEVMTLSAIHAATSESSQSEDESLPDEAVVVCASLQRQIRNLAADEGPDSSDAGSATSVCGPLRQRLLELREQRRARIARIVAEKETECKEQETRQREMRFLVNSGPSAEDLYLIRGALGVRAWLRELDTDA
ncbi:hypothetical protein B0H11DRAFT_1929132 [Mycena galericulata]|nr:hypothetical protein B0H11DRAFT_1929132 [Mycena galericulata]